MKIILAHNNYQLQGGAEVFYHEVARVLRNMGHEVKFFSSYDEDISTELRSYFPQTVNYKKKGLMNKIINFAGMVYNRSAKAEMARLIKDFNPDLIHAFAVYIKLTPSILDAAREAGVPVVMSCNDYKHICPSYKLYHHGNVCEECKGGKFYRASINRCSHDSLHYSIGSTIESYVHSSLNIYRKNVHTFLFSSEFMARKTEQFWGEKTFRWKMLRNPFDSTQYIASQSEGKYGLYFGRLIEEKGVNILLESAALRPNIPIKIVGDGPDRTRLETQAKNLRLNHVDFIGPKWGKDLNIILQDSRFVVVPSLWHENFPYVILQSFAMGKPVVGSNRGGIPELVEHEKRGYIYDANNPVELAEVMSKLMSDSLLANRMGNEGKLFINNEFNDEKFYNSLIEIYNEVLA